MNDAEKSAAIPDILIHAGFHKTGTSSLQTFLELNKSQLSDYFLFYGKDDFCSAGYRARRYGQRPYPWRLWHFRIALRAFLRTVPDGHRLVLSRETFAGIMPGHLRFGRPIGNYKRTAPGLAKAIAAELKRRFGDNVVIEFLYTTRDTLPWQRSVHGHLLRSIRQVQPFETFRTQIGGSGLAPDLRQAQRVLNPIPVHSARLEDYTNKPGAAAQKILDIMGIPAKRREQLIPVGRTNVGHSQAVLDEFLTLNQNTIDPKVLKDNKEAIAAKERKSNG